MTRIVFDQTGEFAASRAAEAWCAQNGYSVGRMEEHRARGVKKGRYDIQKWTDLRQADKDTLEGRL